MGKRTGGLLGASLIIAGTSIGGGMLALPSLTGAAGFYPALFSNVLCWFYALMTGFFLLEACLWSESHNLHLPSLAATYVGKTGKVLVCLLFMFLYECLLIAYFSGGIPSLHRVWQGFAPLGLSGTLGHSYLLFGSATAALMILGTAWIDRVNFILMIALFGTFIGLLVLGRSEVHIELLETRNWGLVFLPLPILLGAYGYHNVIPTLVTYLDRDGKKMRQAIICGTLMPFIVYTLWQWLVLGSVPYLAIQRAQHEAGIPVVEALTQLTGAASIRSLTLGFSIFAILTSLFGVAFSMVDFLSDLCRVAPQGRFRPLLTLVTVLPPLLVAYYNPTLFVPAFSVAAGFGEATLNGLFPIALVWLGVHRFRKRVSLPIFGNRLFLGGLTVFTLAIIILEIRALF